jgi:hypothetical protein
VARGIEPTRVEAYEDTVEEFVAARAAVARLLPKQ